jgi:chromosome segregation protein
LGSEPDRWRAAAAAARADRAAAEGAATAARDAAGVASAEEARRVAERRRAEDAERAAARDLEAVVREAGWHAAQTDRLTADVERARGALAALESAGLWEAADVAGGPSPEPGSAEQGAIATWEARATELRARRDRLAEEAAGRDADRREVETKRARAEASVAIDEARLATIAAEVVRLADREAAIGAERHRVEAELAEATEAERRAGAALGEVRAADAQARDRLAAAERASAGARDRLRSADERLRAADRSDLEARLGRDSLREQLLVELAGLGELGRHHLEAEAGVVGRPVGPAPIEPADEASADVDDSAALESALDAVTDRWASEAPPTDVPSPGRLATLRRRYHELGAANPYAVDEYDELRRRLDGLETQHADLRTAIDKTRGLIAELNTMIATQFRTTFAALETAFDARFQQLFGGGFARLSLTDPEDLSATGIEIVARPPGKKAQALSMLSGGERALTAVALLFAMLEVRPVPFCVLDEVDAALDEANVGRFSEALRGLADRTQFIVITHNRGTIEADDELYGVTVGDDSVSRVISLRLDEARAIADRQRGERIAAAGEPAATEQTEPEPPASELAGVG